MNEPRPTVAGRFRCFSDIWGVFQYDYVCERCGKVFVESTPEVSAPCLCHRCYAGRQGGRVKREGGQ